MNKKSQSLLNEAYRMFLNTSEYRHLFDLTFLSPLTLRQKADIAFIIQVEKELGIKDGLKIRYKE